MGAIFVILVLFIAVSTKQRNAINEMYELGQANGKSGYTIAYENYTIFMKSPQEFTMHNFNWLDSAATFLPYYVMLITTFVTVLSGLRYIVTNYELLNPITILKLIRRKN
jgi:cardiolipin synthase